MIVASMGGIANGNQQEGAKKRRVEKLWITLTMCFNFKHSRLRKYAAQIVECFPCMCKALNSNPSMTKRIKLKILKKGSVSGFSVIGHSDRGHLKIISVKEK
jgi:hypothetical protein